MRNLSSLLVWGLFGTSSIALAVAATACSSGDFDGCEADNNCNAGSGGGDAGLGGAGGGTGGSGGTGGAGGIGGSSGTGGSSGSGGDGGGCDANASPNDQTCVIDEQYGVFVDSGSTAGTPDGTRGAPYKTITEALSAAAGKRVYVCNTNGAYKESLSIGAGVDGVELWGGFDCAGNSWTYGTTKKAKIEGGETAVTITGLTKGADFIDFEISSANAAAGKSSIAVVVADSSGVEFKRVDITAGDGGDGDNGTAGGKGADGAAPAAGQNGLNATCSGAPAFQAGGEWAAVSGCGSQGGKGGPAVKEALGTGGNDGIPKANVTPPNQTNGGAPGATGVAGTQGSPGNAGNNGTAAATVGAFAAGGYTPADGKPGTSGFAGQGGGGGGASNAQSGTGCVGATGGAGGMGGCGGTAGGAGKGGGASVALLSWNSKVRLDTCTLTAGNGGKGGNGGQGGVGGSGSQGGVGGKAGGTALGDAGNGGNGGKGGLGGSGSGASGGASFAVVWSVTQPTEVGAVTLTGGNGGAAGTGGQVPGGVKAPDGAVGQAGQTYEQK